MAAGVWTGGTERPEGTTRVRVSPGGPADVAGVHDDDRVEAVGGSPVNDWDALRSALGKHPSDPVDLALRRDGQPMHVTVTPDASGRIRVLEPMVRTGASLGDGLHVLSVGPATVLYETARGFARTIRGDERVVVGGPVAVVRETANASRSGRAVYFIGCLAAYSLPVFAISAFFVGPSRRPRTARRHSSVRALAGKS